MVDLAGRAGEVGVTVAGENRWDVVPDLDIDAVGSKLVP